MGAIYYFDLFLNDILCRCTSTMARYWLVLRLRYHTPLSNLLQLLEATRTQHGSKWNLYPTKPCHHLCCRGLVSKLSSGSIAAIQEVRGLGHPRQSLSRLICMDTIYFYIDNFPFIIVYTNELIAAACWCPPHYTLLYWLRSDIDSPFISLVTFYSMRLDVRLTQLINYVTYLLISSTFWAHLSMA